MAGDGGDDLVAIACHCDAGAISDAEVLAIVNRHCVMPRKLPGRTKKSRPGNRWRSQEVHRHNLCANSADKRDPLGNQTEMNEHERAILGQWLKELS